MIKGDSRLPVVGAMAMYVQSATTSRFGSSGSTPIQTLQTASAEMVRRTLGLWNKIGNYTNSKDIPSQSRWSHCESTSFLNSRIGDAGNTPLVDAGTPLGATVVVTPGSAGYLHRGVLHPGVPVYAHIRDLSPTAEGCMGGRSPKVTELPWANQLK